MYKQLKASNSISDSSYKDYEKCLELNPRHILALWDLGCIYDIDHDYGANGRYWDGFNCADQAKAIDCFKRIIEIDPKYS